jgi:SAM-dependent methyltransferase
VTDPQRARHALALIDTESMRGVEVGPSFSPFVPKASGADVTVVDHTDAESLRDKYRVHGVDLDAIETVDVVWAGGSLADPLRDRAPFDYIIASHLLEHLPNPIGFLNDCSALLRPGGVLSLVLPDHRYCFDALRPPTTLGQWVDAHLDNRRRHTPGMVLDHCLHAVTRGGIAWTPETTTPFTMAHVRPDVDHTFALARKGDEYVDIHAWVFTPESFRSLIQMAESFELTDLQIAYERDTIGFEFFATLRKPASPGQHRDRFGERLGLFDAARLAENAPPVPAATPPAGRAAVKAALRRLSKGLRRVSKGLRS